MAETYLVGEQVLGRVKLCDGTILEDEDARGVEDCVESMSDGNGGDSVELTTDDLLNLVITVCKPKRA